jgi:hypothetical protein
MGISSSLGSSALLPAGLGFRNVLINGDFRINQRVFTSSASSVYGFDRWTSSSADGTVTYSAQTFTTGNAIPGYEPTNHARIATSGQTLAGAYSHLVQRIENVRTLAGQTASLSFWAKSTSGTPKVAVEFLQIFGTGGSPSSTTFTYAGQVTLSTAWQRFTMQVNIPSISGKTIGTAGDDTLYLNLWTSAGSTYNSRAGSIGIQNSTIDFWGVQLEQNYQATPFEQRPIGVELALCQRYYWRNAIYGAGAVGGSGTVPIITMSFKTPMRASPTITYVSGGTCMNGLADLIIASAYSPLPVRDLSADGAELLFSMTTGSFTNGDPVTVKGAIMQATAEL